MFNYIFFRKLKLNAKLKEAFKAGEVMEDCNSFEFSEDDDIENDAEIEDGFLLPRKLWNKLYK